LKDGVADMQVWMTDGVIVYGYIDREICLSELYGEIPMMSPLARRQAPHPPTAIIHHARLISILSYGHAYDKRLYHPDSLPPAWLLSLLALLMTLGVSSPGLVSESGSTDSS
jgi:hypothetical protein